MNKIRYTTFIDIFNLNNIYENGKYDIFTNAFEMDIPFISPVAFIAELKPLDSCSHMYISNCTDAN